MEYKHTFGACTLIMYHIVGKKLKKRYTKLHWLSVQLVKCFQASKLHDKIYVQRIFCGKLWPNISFQTSILSIEHNNIYILISKIDDISILRHEYLLARKDFFEKWINISLRLNGLIHIFKRIFLWWTGINSSGISKGFGIQNEVKRAAR